MNDDNWKHRETTLRCHTCMWWVEKNDSLGRCRKHAPTLDGWPATFASDWCGDHKLHSAPCSDQDRWSNIEAKYQATSYADPSKKAP